MAEEYLRGWSRFASKGASGWLGCGDTIRFQMFDGGGPLVAQVQEQEVAEFAAGAATQRLQDGLVLTHGFSPALALAGKIGGVADPADPARKIGVSAQQR